MINTDEKLVDRLLTRGITDVYPNKEEVKKRFLEGKRLRFYLGIDPTGGQLHIGHAVQLRKLKEIQDLGHEVIFLIGSFTAMIGDPTDKSATRQQLTQKEVLQNAATYKKQASKIISFSGKNAAKIKFNDKWLGKMSFGDVLELASHFTVQQMAERDMFARRIEEGKPVHLHEFLYPLMQGYDSVAMEVDGEIGGSDQTFNMLAGRTLIKQRKGGDKMVLTLQLLTNDEGKKMSKSEGGLIALDDTPEDMYGKIMAMRDDVILPYYDIATLATEDEIEGIRVQLKEGVNPRDVKARLAHRVVSEFLGEKEADAAQNHFESVFQKNEMPEDMEEFVLSGEMNIIDILIESKLCSSKSEARRMIDQNAIKLDGVMVKDYDMQIFAKDDIVLQRGKRHFRKLIGE